MAGDEEKVPDVVEEQRLRRYGPGVRASARRAVDEVFGTDGPGPFPAGPGITRGGRSMPVVHTEDAAFERDQGDGK